MEPHENLNGLSEIGRPRVI